MNLGYYFWDNFKKAGYAQGKLVKGLYQKEVVDGKKNSKTFVDEQTETVMGSERKKTSAQIEVLSDEIKSKELTISSIKKEMEIEKKKIADSYDDKISSLTNEKKRIESCFSTYSAELAEKAKNTGELFDKLTQSLGKYADDTQDYISKQSDKTKNSFDLVLSETKNFILDDIKRDFLAFKAQNVEKKTNTGRSRLYTIILILLCSFDVVAGFISLQKVNMGNTGLNLFIAMLMVAIGMVLVYFSGIETKKEGGSKQLGLLCVLTVILIFAIYTILALETDTISDIITAISNKQFSFIIPIFLADGNLTFFILRLLILPALFVGDILIKMIDADAILESLHLGNGVGKLINRGLFFLRKRAFTKCVEEEKKRYGEVLDEFKQISIPGSEDVLTQIEKLEAKIMPISNELINKRNECEANVKDLDGKIATLLKEEEGQLNNIDTSYADLIAREEEVIKKNSMIINALNEQLGRAEISVRGGLGLGLID